MILFEKSGQHQPFNRQAERYAKAGVPLSLSTLADQVGGCAAALKPLLKRVEAHVLNAERLHGDDTTVPVLAKGKTDTGRLWTYVRDDQPFGGPAPPAAMFYYSRDRAGEHPQAHLATYTGSSRPTPTAVTASSTSPAASQGRSSKRPAGPRSPAVLRAGRSGRERPSQGSRQNAGSDLAAGAGGCPAHRCPLRHRADDQWSERRARGRPPGLSAPLVADLEAWMREERAKLSRGNDVAKAIDYMLKRWTGSRAFSMTGASACRTMPPSEACAVLPSAASHGCSPVPIAADSGLPPSSP